MTRKAQARRRRYSREPRDRPWRDVAQLQTDWCYRCGKWTYPTAKTATRAARTAHPTDPKLEAYPCPVGNGHHYGHDQP